MADRYEKAREMYIQAGWRQGVTLQTVAEHCNLPYQSVRRRAARERWRLERERLSIDPESCKDVNEYIYYYK
jgi:hypothetical protein